jgi:hypothetical protein
MQGRDDCDRTATAQCGTCRRGHVACAVGGEGLSGRPRPKVARTPQWAGIEEAIRAADAARAKEARTTHRLLRDIREDLYVLGLALADRAAPATRRVVRTPDAGAEMGRRVERAPEGVAGPGPRTQARRAREGVAVGDVAEVPERRVRKKRKRVRSAETIDIDD